MLHIHPFVQTAIAYLRYKMKNFVISKSNFEIPPRDVGPEESNTILLLIFFIVKTYFIVSILLYSYKNNIPTYRYCPDINSLPKYRILLKTVNIPYYISSMVLWRWYVRKNVRIRLGLRFSPSAAI